MPDSPTKPQPPVDLLSVVITWTWRIYWLSLFVATHLPKPPAAALVDRIGDKLVHAAAYLLLALLGGWSAKRRNLRLDLKWAGRWWLIYAGYAAADEFLQGIPILGRACQFGDWLADLAGVTIALTLIWSVSSVTNQSASAESSPNLKR